MKKGFVAAAVAGFVFIVAFLDPLKTVQWNVADLFFVSKSAPLDLTIIAIDPASLSQEAGLGRFKDWPRSYYAQLLRKVAQYKPRAVAFDLDFSEASQGVSQLWVDTLLKKNQEVGGNLDFAGALGQFKTAHPDDADFLKSAQASGVPVVLASTLLFNEVIGQGAQSFPPVGGEKKPIFEGTAISRGYVNAFLDRDGILRRFQPFVGQDSERFPSFASAVVSAVGGGAQDGLGNFPPNRMSPIRYYGRPGAFKTLSFANVLAGQFDAADIENKIILVGATAPVIHDVQSTPTSRDDMSGVEIQANQVAQLLGGKKIIEMKGMAAAGFAALLALIAIFVFMRVSLRGIFVVAAILILGFPVGAFGLYQGGLIVNVVYPELAFVVSLAAGLWYRNVTELREKRRLKGAFSHYVSPVVVDEILKNPASLRLGGARKKITVLFSDIVGFTTLSEKLSPEDTVALLNEYLTAMTEIIFSLNGTLDKYQGDAIMALFGAPLDDRAHAVNACSAALGMRKALVALHEKWREIPNLPFKEELTNLDFRVGIATGPAVIGNVGSEKRFDYTAIGDIVNLGSRLEGVNKKYGTHIMVDKVTFTVVTEGVNPFIFRKLDVVRVKGKKNETEIFELLGLAEMLTAEMRASLDDFENGRVLYTERNFTGAREHFERVLARNPIDGPAQIYRNRCDYFLRKPPQRDWSPIVVLEEK